MPPQPKASDHTTPNSELSFTEDDSEKAHTPTRAAAAKRSDEGPLPRPRAAMVPPSSSEGDESGSDEPALLFSAPRPVVHHDPEALEVQARRADGDVESREIHIEAAGQHDDTVARARADTPPSRDYSPAGDAAEDDITVNIDDLCPPEAFGQGRSVAEPRPSVACTTSLGGDSDSEEIAAAQKPSLGTAEHFKTNPAALEEVQERQTVPAAMRGMIMATPTGPFAAAIVRRSSPAAHQVPLPTTAAATLPVITTLVALQRAQPDNDGPLNPAAFPREPQEHPAAGDDVTPRDSAALLPESEVPLDGGDRHGPSEEHGAHASDPSIPDTAAAAVPLTPPTAAQQLATQTQFATTQQASAAQPSPTTQQQQQDSPAQPPPTTQQQQQQASPAQPPPTTQQQQQQASPAQPPPTTQQQQQEASPAQPPPTTQQQQQQSSPAQPPPTTQQQQQPSPAQPPPTTQQQQQQSSPAQPPPTTQQQQPDGLDEWDAANRRFEEAGAAARPAEPPLVNITWDDAYRELRAASSSWRPYVTHELKRVSDRVHTKGIWGTCWSFWHHDITEGPLYEERDFVLALRQLPFDHANLIHRRILITIWRFLTKPGRSVADPPTTGPAWTALGFQGNDPGTDLRANGLFSLLQLLFLVDYLRPLSHAMYEVASSRLLEFPLALVSFNFTAVASQCLLDRALHDAIVGRYNKRQQQLGTAAVERALKTNGGTVDVAMVCNEVYAGCMFKFFEKWQEETQRRITDFDPIRRQLAKHAGEKPNSLLNAYQTARKEYSREGVRAKREATVRARLGPVLDRSDGPAARFSDF